MTSRSYRPRMSFCLLVLACISVASVSRAADTPKPKNVLILYSLTAREATDGFAPIESALRSKYNGPINFDVEYLESSRFDASCYEQTLADLLASTYHEKKIDLVMAAIYPALAFAVKHRDQIFPGAPIVFFSVAPRRFEGQKMWPGVTGVTYDGGAKSTIDLARQLQPETQNVAVIADATPFERYMASIADQQIKSDEPGVRTINLVGLPSDQLLAAANALPPHTVALFLMVPVASSNPAMSTFGLLNSIAERVPTYCIQTYCFGHGVVGGSFADFAEQGIEAGKIGARILSGETPEKIPVVAGSTSRAHVDAQQLRRWRMKQSALPAQAVILNPQPSLLQILQFTTVDWTLLALVGVVCLLLLAEFLRHYLQSKKVKRRLQAEEGRFQLIADAMPFLIWTSDEGGDFTYINKNGRQLTNSALSSDLSQSWLQSVHADDLEDYLSAISSAILRKSGFSSQYRLRRSDGEFRWMLEVAAPRIDETGTFFGLIGSASDITDQMLAQEALHGIGGRLIEAQEKERSRIARELHDDICQKLALLSMELEMSKRIVSRPGGPMEMRIEEIRLHCSEIAADVQALSHELHSSRLDYLGLAVALQSFCEDFSRQQDVNVDFKCERVPAALPKTVALSLFRIAQEGMHNSLKYSGVDRFSLRLWGAGDSVHLEISDDGEGFNVDQAKAGKGLGLISMKERAILVNGSFAIDSQLHRGTRILVSVPITGDTLNLAASPGRYTTHPLTSLNGSREAGTSDHAEPLHRKN